MAKRKTTSKVSKKVELNSEYENASMNEKGKAQLVLLRQEVYELQNKLRDIANIIKR